MALYKGKEDLYWTSEGDFHLDSVRSDLRDTATEQYRNLIQQVLTRVMSSRGDWPLQKNIGASIADFLGHRNTRETAEQIKTRITAELIRDGLIAPNDLNVDIIPTSRSSILLLILVTPLQSKKAVYLTFTYDLAENKMVPRNT